MTHVGFLHGKTDAKVTSTVVDPTTRRVHKPGGVQVSNPLGQFELGVRVRDLTPTFVVDDLEGDQLCCSVR